MLGEVYLVGAGPGDPDLITVKGRRLIESCDALVYDFLVHEAMLGWAPEGSERHYVGKRAGCHALAQEAIGELLIELARAGKRVVRLKGGDPLIFGRGGEEIAALRAAGIAYEVVPAVTAALGCAAALEIALTHRDWTRAVTLVSGHEAVNHPGRVENWRQYARSEATLVLYMAMGRLGEICAELVAGGRAAETPVCVVQWGTLPQQRQLVATLGTVAEAVAEADMGPPAIVIIGEVVGGRRLG